MSKEKYIMSLQNKLKEHPIIIVLLIVVSAIVGLGTFTESIDKTIIFYEKYFGKSESIETQMPEFSIFILNSSNEDLIINSVGEFYIKSSLSPFMDTVIDSGKFLIGSQKENIANSKNILIPAGINIDFDAKFINGNDYVSYLDKKDFTIQFIIYSQDRIIHREGILFSKDLLLSETIAIEVQKHPILEEEIVTKTAQKIGNKTEYIDKLSVKEIEKHFSSKSILPESRHNESPTAFEFLSFLQKHPQVAAHGYRQSINQNDQITLKGLILMQNYCITETKLAVLEFCTEADEIDISNCVYCAWD